MNAIILLLLVYIAVGDAQGSDYDQELENMLTEIEEREGLFNSIKSFVINSMGLSAPETTPINTMSKGISKADCQNQLKDYCDKLQLECTHADVVYIYGGEKNAGNCFLHFEEELHGLQAKNIKQMMKNVEKTGLSGNSKKKYVSTALDREVVAFARQKDATWGLSRVGDANRVTNSWQSEYPFEHKNYGYGVRVFVMDTGMDSEWMKKEEFAGRVEAGKDFTTDGVGVKDMDSHGTHCAGTVLGKKYGVAKKATLVPVKVLDKNGDGAWSWIIKGMEWIQEQCEKGAPCVASASLGGPKYSAINTAVNSLVDSGVVFVAAAGNEGVDACNDSPASAEKAITVGSVDHNLQRSVFFRGESNYGKCVDIWGPGSEILSTVLDGNTAHYSGTSMAAPHVSGVVAAYISESGETDPTILKEKLLKDAVEDVVKDAKSPKSGFVQLEYPELTFTYSRVGNCAIRLKTIGKPKSLEEATKLFVASPECAVVGATLQYSGYSYSWGAHCCAPGSPIDSNKNWKQYSAAPKTTFTYSRVGNCAKRLKTIGKPKSLKEALKLFVAAPECAVEGATLQYSRYSYSWGAHCCAPGSPIDSNKNWQQYSASRKTGKLTGGR